MISALIFHLTTGQAIAVSFMFLCIGIYIGTLLCRQITHSPKESIDEDEHD